MSHTIMDKKITLRDKHLDKPVRVMFKDIKMEDILKIENDERFKKVKKRGRYYG